MTTFNNLEEFFAHHGLPMTIGVMQDFGKELYDGYGIGPWVSYNIKTKDKEDINFTITVLPALDGSCDFNYSENTPEDILGFFDILENHQFDEYFELIKKYKEENEVHWNYEYTTANNGKLVITGNHTIPGLEHPISSSDKQCSVNSLELAHLCTGINIGSIVEGADHDATPFYLDFPFTSDDFDKGMQALIEEVQYEWEKHNSLYYTVRATNSREVLYTFQWIDGETYPVLPDDVSPHVLKLAVDAGEALDAHQTLNEIPLLGHPNRIVVREDAPYT